MPGPTQLDPRKITILKVVVTDYVRTAQPVGSQYLACRYPLGIKPATIRNELAEMSEMGYLRQPHTSAGRVPSDLGYRFYVDRLMEPMTIPAGQARQARSYLEEQAIEIDEIVNQTCRILAELTNYMSLATRPSMDETRVRLVSLSRFAKDKLLLVLVLSDGSVEHRIVDVKRPVSDAETLKLANSLTAQVVDKTLQELSTGLQEVPEGTPFAKAYTAVMASIMKIAHSAGEGDIFVEGTNHILKQPEFKDVDRLERLLEALQQRKALFRLLSAVLLGPGTKVVIGSENPYTAMQDASLVAATYSIGARVCGSIGVIGPTRMDYRRATAAVNLMARSLSDLLTTLSVG